MDNGYNTPEGISFFEEEQSNGCQSVETLAVANILVVPTERHQHSTKLVNLAKQKLHVQKKYYRLQICARMYETLTHAPMNAHTVFKPTFNDMKSIIIDT